MTSFTLVDLLYIVIIAIPAANNGMIVHTQYGDIEGEVNNIGVAQFKKIPYAKAPIDDLRWAPPREAETWSDTLDAKEQDVPSCLQGCVPKDCPFESEDCLYLNIWTPVDAHYGSNYAVIVWIHGGNFHAGEGDDELNDPSNFIKNIGELIFVNIHYRVGIMGFFYDNTFGTGLRGNYGFLDQSLAIKWVYQNIDRFGGDKDNIVIAGDSSGAVAVSLHLLFAAQYIKAGIMHSPHVMTPLRDPKTWYDVPQQFSKLINCSHAETDSDHLLECWRSVDGYEILAVQLCESAWPNGALSTNWASNVPWTPTVHTALLPNQPIHEWRKADVETPPFIIGNTKDEAFYAVDPRFEAYYDYATLFWQTSAMWMDQEIAAQVLGFYGVSEESTYSGRSYLYDYGEIVTDLYICAIRNVLSNLRQQTKDIYYYNFDVVDQELFTNVLWASADNFGACFDKTCHFTDIPYLFTPPIFTENNLFDADTLSIGMEMQRLWANYAKQLNPNGNGYHVWPRYSNKRNVRFNFLSIAGVDEFVAKSTLLRPDPDPDTNFCQFWDQIGYAGRFSLATDLSTSPASTEAVFSVFSLRYENALIYICFAILLAIIILNILCCYKTKKKGLYSRIKNSTDTEDEAIETDEERVNINV